MGLALSRKPGESITLTDDRTGELVCEILVSRIEWNVVRLSLDAPQHIRILRAELEQSSPESAA